MSIEATAGCGPRAEAIVTGGDRAHADLLNGQLRRSADDCTSAGRANPERSSAAGPRSASSLGSRSKRSSVPQPLVFANSAAGMPRRGSCVPGAYVLGQTPADWPDPRARYAGTSQATSKSRIVTLQRDTLESIDCRGQIDADFAMNDAIPDSAACIRNRRGRTRHRTEQGHAAGLERRYRFPLPARDPSASASIHVRTSRSSGC